MQKDGKFTKEQKWPLADGTYDLVVRDCGEPAKQGAKKGACTMDPGEYEVLFNSTVRIGPEHPAAEAGDMEAMKAKMAELNATIAALEATIAEMLERMNSVNKPVVQQQQPPPAVEVPEQVPGQYYIRLLNSTDTTYGIGDRIHFEGRGPLCDTPTYIETLGANHTDYHGGSINIGVHGMAHHEIAKFRCVEGKGVIGTYTRAISPTDGHVEYDGNHLEGNMTDYRGYFTVHEHMKPGEHYVYAWYVMDSLEKDRQYPEYYTGKFTFGNTVDN